MIEKIQNLFDNPVLFSVFRLIIHNSFKDRQKIFEQLNMTGKEKVIDVCCGTGYFSQILPDAYIGIDSNKNYIEYANRGYKKDSSNKKFILGDATDLSQFADKTFDIAFIIDSLHHFPDELASRVISEACRLAKKVVILDFTIQSSLNPIAKILEKSDRGKYVRTIDEEVALARKFINIEVKKLYHSGIVREMAIIGVSK